MPFDGESGLVQSCSLVIGNIQAGVGYVESLLLILLADLCFWRFLGGILGHFCGTVHLSVQFHFVLQVTLFASLSESGESLNLNLQVGLEKSVSEYGEIFLVGMGWGVVLGVELDAGVILLRFVFSVDDGVAEDFQGLGLGRESLGGVVGSIGSGKLDEELVGPESNLEEVLDLSLGLLVQVVVNARKLLEWRDSPRFTQDSDGNDASLVENFLGILVGVRRFV